MRALLAIAALAATLATTSASKAQTDSPAYYPWCALDTVASDVVRRSCGFTSYAQCLNSVRGQNGICFENIWPGKPASVSEAKPARKR
jgi:hypothetical protein